jgi:hypothetical protein
MPQDDVKADEWINVGHKFKLLALPYDVIRHIFPHTVDKPDAFEFDDQRITARGIYRPQWFRGHGDLVNTSRVCKAFNEAINRWCYSNSIFVFRSISAFSQFLAHIGERNRSYLRKVVLQLSCYDYFDIFTPHHIVSMLDVALWSFEKVSLRSNIATLNLESLTIRVPDGTSIYPELPYPLEGQSTRQLLVPLVDISWIMASALELQKDTGYPKRVHFETAHAPHRRIHLRPPFVLHFSRLM